MSNRVRPKHAVIILAAGASDRLGAAKQLVMIEGESLLHRTIRIVLDTHPQQSLVVLGHDAERIYRTIDHYPIQRIDCMDWQQGMSASLRAGIQSIDVNCQGALVILCDQPALTSDHLNSLIAAWLEQPHRAVASAYANVVGVPALLPRSWFERLLAIQGDQGARTWLRDNPDVIPIDAPELVRDIDTPQDLSE